MKSGLLQTKIKGIRTILAKVVENGKREVIY